MTYKITITGFDSGLNELLNGVYFDWKTKRIVNRVKYKYEQMFLKQIRFSDIRNVKLQTPIVMYYHIYAKDKKHDRMNIGSAFDKIFQDTLQKAGLLKNDGWGDVLNAHFEFDIDKSNPRVEVTIVEVDSETKEAT